MGDVVNLRVARKQRARDCREKLAAENRLIHGRSKADKIHQQQLDAREQALFDGHRRERATDNGGQDD